MKRPVFSLFFLIFTLFCTVISATANGTITSYNASFHVAENGETAVSTSIQITFDQATTQVTFPIGDGTKGAIAGYDADRIAHTDGTALQLTNESGFIGTQTFQISYDLMSPVVDEGDQQVLTLDLLPAGYGYNIDKLTYSVTLPQAFAASPTYVGGYRDEIVDNYLDLSQTEATFSGTSLETFLDHDSLVATLLLPADFLDYHSAIGLPTWLALGLVAVLVSLSVLYWYATLFDYSPPKNQRTTPPDIMGAGDFSYFFAKKPPVFSIELLDFATKGLVTIHCSGHHTVTLERGETSADTLPKAKASALMRLFSKKPVCPVKSAAFSYVSRKYSNILRNHWRKSTTDNYTGDPVVLKYLSTLTCAIAVLGAGSAGLPAGNDRWLWLWGFFVGGLILGAMSHDLSLSILQKRWIRTVLSAVGVLSILGIGYHYGGLFTIILAFFTVVLSDYATFSGKRKNSLGRKMVAQSKDYARYLSTVTRQELLTELKENDQYFYEILPYAEAIGQGKYVASQLKNVSLAPCKWLVSNGKPPRTAGQFRTYLLQVLAVFEAN